MTYCLAMHVDAGLVFATDSRSNAGVDYVTTYSKLHVFNPSPDRIMVILSAGNLATTQEVINIVNRDLELPDSKESLRTPRYMFEAADYIGSISLAVQSKHGAILQQSGVSGEATLILGGQIKGHPPEILLIYPQGNYISATTETPYLQIGESKYGKPVLDRVLRRELSLEDCARLAIVSLDATRGSNITVGLPFEVATYRQDTLQLEHRLHLDENSECYQDIRNRWHDGLRRVFRRLPKFDWEAGDGSAEELDSNVTPLE